MDKENERKIYTFLEIPVFIHNEFLRIAEKLSQETDTNRGKIFFVALANGMASFRKIPRIRIDNDIYKVEIRTTKKIPENFNGYRIKLKEIINTTQKVIKGSFRNMVKLE